MGVFLPLVFINNIFLLIFFSGSLSFRINILWAQLLLELSTDHFETMHICSTESEDFRVVLGLSSYYTDLDLTNLYKQNRDIGGLLPATGVY